jgi:hypothetical protein
MAELDPVTDLLGNLLTVSATPLIGSANVAPDSALQFLSWLQGDDSQPITVSLPLSIKANNLLLGNKCAIDEFQLNLTTGTPVVPEGVPTMTGGNGVFTTTTYRPTNGTAGIPFSARVGAEVVDNAFAVPGASQCDLLVGDLLDQPTGLFDSTVNGQVGLPAASGNHARFKVDTVMVPYNRFLIGATGAPAPLNFGDVAVGSASAVQTVTVTGASPMPFTALPGRIVGFGTPQFQIVDDRCAGLVLDLGDTCEVDLRFAPTTAGTKSTNFEIRELGQNLPVAWAGAGNTLRLNGRGI